MLAESRDLGRLLKRFVIIVAILLVPFVVATAFGGWERVPALPASSGLAVAIVVGLLTADVVLPVPSSAVLVAAGAALGPLGGAVAGTVGLVLGALIGYELGSRFDQQPPASGAEHASGLFHRWGPAALVLSRPVPLLSESMSVIAGGEGIDRRVFLAAVVVGAVPTAAGLSMVGHAGLETLDGRALTLVLFATLVAGAAAAWRPTYRRSCGN